MASKKKKYYKMREPKEIFDPILLEKDPKTGWLKQVMGYAKTQGLTRVDFAILHLIQPELLCWTVDFEQWEIDENWKWLQDRKEIWDQAVTSGEAPKPFTYNELWECKGCSYKLVCDARSMAEKYG